MLLIAYDIIVIIDPTRCFFLNCNDAYVNASNSTTNITISGWPLYITWPNYFQTNMNAKRIFQSIQLLCAGLFILFAALYLLTYYIYRHIKLHQQTVYNADRGTFTTDKTTRVLPTKDSKNASQTSLLHNPQYEVTTYMIVGQPYAPGPVTTVTLPKKTKMQTIVRLKGGTVDYGRLCTRCNEKSRMVLTSNYERQNHFSNLCSSCNTEVANDHRKVLFGFTKSNRPWRP
jgi:hypothetical protein